MATIREFTTRWGFEVDDRQIKALDKHITRTQKNIAAFGRIAVDTGKKMTLGITLPFVGASVAAVKLASDAEETRNKFNEIFKGFDKEGKESVGRLKSEFKLAGSTAQELLSDTGDLLKGLGLTGDEALRVSEEVVKLSGDVASFKNVQGGTTAASRALTKALLGERESLKLTFKTAVSEKEVQEEAAKITATRTDLSERAAKALATLRIVQRRNTDAIGDFARTSGGVANKTRIVIEQIKGLSEQFGEILLPVASKLLSVMSDVLSFFQELSPGVKKTILIVGALVAAVGPLLIVLGSLAQAFVWIRVAMLALRLAGVKSLSALLLPLLKIIAIGVAVGLVMEDIVGFFQGKKSVTGVLIREFANLFDFLTEKFGMLPGFVQGIVAHMLMPFRLLISTIRGVSGAIGAVVGGDFGLALEALKQIPQDAFKPYMDVLSGKKTSLGATLGFGNENYSGNLRGLAGVRAVSSPTDNSTQQQINAPITVNVPPGTSPEAVSPVVEREFRKGMDRLAREINRQGKGAVVN